MYSLVGQKELTSIRKKFIQGVTKAIAVKRLIIYGIVIQMNPQKIGFLCPSGFLYQHLKC